jgi:ribosome-associated translation inhibitor RaiA
VTVQAETSRHHQGNLFSVHVSVRVPGSEIVASRDPGRNHAHEDVFVSLRDAFQAIFRQLEDYVRRRQGDVKRHESVS